MKLDDDAGEMQRMKTVLSGKFAPPQCAVVLSLLAVLVLSACASGDHRAPVDERRVAPGAGPVATTATPQTANGSATAPQALPGAENAGKPGYYTVKPGDTLLRIALEAGQPWRDVARWSQLTNPNVIEVGQVLRVVPPMAEGNVTIPPVVAGPAATGTRPVAPANRGDARPLDGSTAVPGASASASAAVPALSPEEDLNWMWPAAGPVVTGFDDLKSKGLAITGNAGDPVLAAADGRVVYAGSGLRGYGNLVIVKHNNTFLTAYAHNQTLLVKEDQVVRRGQQIAEMGSSDAERVQLHFEIRRQGRPIDPARLLPPR
jgi:lipoprotein NlpD